MAQQFNKGENQKPIKRAGVIRPKEPMTVYVNHVVASHSSNGYKAGQEVELHRVAAERWIATGKASKTKEEALATVPSGEGAEAETPNADKTTGKGDGAQK